MLSDLSLGLWVIVCRFGVLNESLWRHAIEASMGPDSLVVGPPDVDDRPSVGDIAEQVVVEAFVREPAVEAFDEPVLLRLA